MKKQTKTNNTAQTLTIIGAAAAGLAATAYFFLGPNGKKHQKHAKAWAIKMKGDVVEKLELAREISEPIYHQIIDAVAAEYEDGKKASGEEVRALAGDLKKHWKSLKTKLMKKPR